MESYEMHGGHFAPNGLMKIESGGSHAENPNGGVQLGVDEQGIPNLVEEDEVIYKDFVYSDNIEADEEFLEQFNLPKKYKGKLYSDIAEKICDDNGEQIDPITLNGLNAMLGRLAQAQEAQKAAEEEKELMEILEKMTPEERAQLEEALAQDQMAEQQALQAQQEQAIQPQGEEEMAAEPAPMMPMAEGGLIRRFDGGGRAGSRGQKALNLLRDVADFVSPVEQKEIVLPDGSVGTVQYAMPPMVDKAAGAVKGAVGNFKKTRALRRLGRHINNYTEPVFTSGFKKALPWLAFGAASGIGAANRVWGDPDIEGAEHDYVINPNDFADGGQTFGINNSRLQNFWQSPYSYPYAPTNIEYTLYPRRRTHTGPLRQEYIDNLGETGYLWANPAYLNFPDEPNHPVGQDIQTYNAVEREGVMADLDRPKPKPAIRGIGTPLPTGQMIAPNVPDANLTVADLDKIAAGRDVGVPLEVLSGPSAEIAAPEVTLADRTKFKPSSNPGSDNDTGSGEYPTWMRYAGALGSGFLALQNLLQEPDHYENTPIRPYLPYGRLSLQRERYMPVDENFLRNQHNAQANATARALRDSGLGPSLSASLLAADYNAQTGLGNSLLQVWQANNNERNRVISTNNGATTQEAQFYDSLEKARANALNQMAMYNQRNALQVQMLNNQAESQKYAAFGQNLDNALAALSDIGYENINRNMVNSNTALYWDTDRRGVARYKGRLAACGGMLKTPKKK